MPRIVKILLHLLQRRDLELKTAATSFLIRLYAQVERKTEREREREREMQPDAVYTRQALVLRMKLDECDG